MPTSSSAVSGVMWPRVALVLTTIATQLLIRPTRVADAKGLVGKLPGNPASCQQEPCNSDPKHVLAALKIMSIFLGSVLVLPLLLYYMSKFLTKIKETCCSRVAGKKKQAQPVASCKITMTSSEENDEHEHDNHQHEHHHHHHHQQQQQQPQQQQQQQQCVDSGIHRSGSNQSGIATNPDCAAAMCCGGSANSINKSLSGRSSCCSNNNLRADSYASASAGQLKPHQPDSLNNLSADGEPARKLRAKSKPENSARYLAQNHQWLLRHQSLQGVAFPLGNQSLNGSQRDERFSYNSAQALCSEEEAAGGGGGAGPVGPVLGDELASQPASLMSMVNGDHDNNNVNGDNDDHHHHDDDDDDEQLRQAQLERRRLQERQQRSKARLTNSIPRLEVGNQRVLDQQAPHVAQSQDFKVRLDNFGEIVAIERARFHSSDASPVGFRVSPLPDGADCGPSLGSTNQQIYFIGDGGGGGTNRKGGPNLEVPTLGAQHRHSIDGSALNKAARLARVLDNALGSSWRPGNGGNGGPRERSSLAAPTAPLPDYGCGWPWASPHHLGRQRRGTVAAQARGQLEGWPPPREAWMQRQQQQLEVGPHLLGERQHCLVIGNRERRRERTKYLAASNQQINYLLPRQHTTAPPPPLPGQEQRHRTRSPSLNVFTARTRS
jgi:hypothetical protein